MIKKIIAVTFIFSLASIILFSCLKSPVLRKHKTAIGQLATDSEEIIISGSTPFNRANSPKFSRDKDFSTYWLADGYGQWLQFELKEKRPVASVSIAFQEGNRKIYKFAIQLSDDGKTWGTKFSGQSSGQSENFENFRLSQITPAKFIRILGHGNSVNTLNSYTEVNIQTPNEGYAFSNSNLNFKPQIPGYKRSHIIDHENFSQVLFAVGTNVTSKTLTPPFYTQAVTDYNMVYSDQLVKSGTRTARIELRPYAKNTIGKTTSGNLSNDKTVIRSEILLAKLQEREVWYSVAMFLPKTISIINGDTIPAFVTDSNYDIITQWHAWDDTHLGEKARNPPLALFIENGKLAFKKYWSVDSVNTNVKTNIPGRQGYQTFDLGPASEVTGKWLNWVYHFVYDYRPNGKGQIQVWLNGVNVIDDYGPNIFNDKKKYPYFKAGLYKRDFDKGTPKRVLYLDEIYHGDFLATYNDVRTD